MRRSLYVRLSLVVLLFASVFSFIQAAPAAAAASWWDGAYSHRLGVHIQTADAIASGYSIKITIDHAAMVSGGNSLASGNDVRVVYWNGTTNTELDRLLEPGTNYAPSAWNTSSTSFWFKTQAAIGAGVADNGTYWIYYGNNAAGAPPANGNNVFALYDDFSSGIDGAVWTVQADPGLSTYASGGEVVSSGTTDASSQYSLNGLRTKASFGPGYSSSVSFRIVSQSTNAQANWKGEFGVSASTQLGIKSSGSNAKRVQYYTTGWNDIAPSTLNGQTFASHRVETSQANGVAREVEDGVVKATRTGGTLDYNPSFTYGPDDINETFDVRFDDVVIRRFVANEPNVTLDIAKDIQVSVNIEPAMTFTVANASTACNGESNFISGAGGPSSISLGHMTSGNNVSGGQTLSIVSNAGGGFVVSVQGTAAGSNFRSAGHAWADSTGTYSTPALLGAGERFGYTYKDSTPSTNLSNPANAKFIALTNTNDAVMSSVSSGSGNGCVSFDAQSSPATPAGAYSGTIIYRAVPTF